jgi:geranylgeranyl reductase family protein
MEQTEVAIIGAGPGGSATAYHLAASGIKVVLLDKKIFPRDKTCGDLITIDGLQVLERMNLGEWASGFKQVRALQFTSPDGKILDTPVTAARGDVAARIIPRRLLDYELVQAAVRVGARLVDGVCVRDVVLNGARPRVLTDNMEIEADLVILADGSQAPVSRRLGMVKDDFDLLAVQQYLVGDSDPAGPVEFHFQQAVIPGYTWLIPMGDGQFNIGAGTYTSRIRRNELNLKEILEMFKTNHPVSRNRLANSEPLGPIKAHPLRTNLKGTHTHADRVLVVGDAAGLVSPFTGEGIAPALVSAQFAAVQAQKALIAGDFSEKFLAPYTQALRRRYLADKRAGRILRMILRNPSLLNHIFRRMRRDDGMAQQFMHVFLDECSPAQLLNLKTLLKIFY